MNNGELIPDPVFDPRPTPDAEPVEHDAEPAHDWRAEWEISSYHARRRDGLCVSLPHPAIWPISLDERPRFVVERPDHLGHLPVMQAPLEAVTLGPAMEEAERRFPMAPWMTAPEPFFRDASDDDGASISRPMIELARAAERIGRRRR